MDKTTWEAIPSTIRDMVIAAFKMAGIDFEREYVTTAEEKTRQHETSPWMSRRDAAQYACVSPDTIDNWCAAGYIEKAKIGAGRPGGVLIDRNSLEKFLRSKISNRKKRARVQPPSVNGGYRVSSATN